jgi:polar amino acid transport system substrate-binding protein
VPTSIRPYIARCPRRALVALVSLVWCGAAPGFAPGADSSASAATAEPPPTLRVVTLPTAPFVLPRTATPQGFSVDVWNEMARRLHVDSSWRVANDPATLLRAVRSGDADVAVGAIGMTPEREKVVDFSMAYFDSGLRIAVRTQSAGGLASNLRSIPWLAIGHLLLAGIVIIFVLANVLCLIERRNRAAAPKNYLRALGECLWRTLLVIATLSVDSEAPAAKRVAVVLVWLFGVVLIAQLTATVTSTQTIARMQSTIRGPDDLPGKSIASAPGTVAGDYLTARGLPFKSVTYGPDGIRMLVTGEVQAVVFDAPTLQYWAAKQGNGLVEVVGPLFRPQKYGIAVALGSPLRKQINQVLLNMYADGTYEKIYASWFATAH